MNYSANTTTPHIPWNKGKLMGQKSPFKRQQVWAIRIRLELADHKRDLALFNLALDSKLRGCDLLSLRVSDLLTGDEIRARAKIIQSKTGNAVQFEVTKRTRDAVMDWIINKGLHSPMNGYSQAVKTESGIYQHANTPVSLKRG